MVNFYKMEYDLVGYIDHDVLDKYITEHKLDVDNYNHHDLIVKWYVQTYIRELKYIIHTMKIVKCMNFAFHIILILYVMMNDLITDVIK